MDSISLGNKLPFYDREFDSVTMRSVWQYLRFPFDLLKELKRVVLIGSQVFIIGVNDLTCEDTGIAERSSKIRKIEREIQQAGYQTKLDWIGKSQRRRRFLRTRLKIGCVRVRL